MPPTGRRVETLKLPASRQRPGLVTATGASSVLMGTEWSWKGDRGHAKCVRFSV
jgi:hypothetical protein